MIQAVDPAALSLPGFDDANDAKSLCFFGVARKVSG